MSRRKQSHPKSMKEEDQSFVDLPGELKYEEQTNEIVTRVDLDEGHHFGPFPALLEIEDQIESFHLLHIKHNWLVFCSQFHQSPGNLHLTFHDNQLFVMTKQPIPSGTRLYSNKIILPSRIKQEPIEAEIPPEGRVCDGCGIRFTNRNTLTAHREHYCTKSNHFDASTKRKSPDDSSFLPVKRLLSEKSIPFTHPVQIGQFIYVPIPIVTSQPLDLSKPKKTNQCEYCSITFQSLETLQAHQENYCLQKQKTLSRFNQYLLKCTICSAMFRNEQILVDHIKSAHTNTSLIECLECRSKFCSKWNLIRHMKLLHTNIKSDDSSFDAINLISQKYSCPSCRIRFAHVETLIEHMKNYCSSYEITLQHPSPMFYRRTMNTKMFD